jgi:hypothetical protein
MRSEPPIPADRRCVVCKKKITTVDRYGEADAFCSAVCCREWFGTSIQKPEKGVTVS